MRKPSVSQQIIFIHGAGGFDEDKRLADGVQAQLGRAVSVHYPQMPDDAEVTYARWREAILQALGDDCADALLVGHSFGASVLLKVLAEKEIGQVTGVFALAAPFWGAQDWQVPDYALPEDAGERLAALPLTLYHAQDDDVVPFSHLAHYQQLFPQATPRPFAHGGHQLQGHVDALAADLRAHSLALRR